MYLRDYTINRYENEDENEKQITYVTYITYITKTQVLGKIDLDLDMDTNMPKYKTCQSIMMLTCIKQHLTNI